MSAGGQAADYYHCMNMNEMRRRTVVAEERERTASGGGGRTSAEKDVRMRTRLEPDGERCLVAERANPRGRLCDRGVGRRRTSAGKTEREREREAIRARGREEEAREEAASGESAKGAAFN